jgi:thiol-disulfide isomerase/thioredoxin
VGTSFALAKTFGETKVPISYNDPPVLSSAKGEFSIEAAPIGYTPCWSRAQDGTLDFANRKDSEPTRIVLLKPALLTVRIVKPFGHQHPFGPKLLAGGSAIGYASALDGPSELLVPQGTLELSVGDEESLTVDEKVVRAAGKPASVQVSLRPTLWAQSLGKPAPALSPTDSRNWPPGASLETQRSKWVLLTYWATWCQPCIREMPVLTEFYEKNAAAHERLEIVAMHSPDGASFDGIKSAYERLVKVWGKPPPFPLLFDSSGETPKRGESRRIPRRC